MCADEKRCLWCALLKIYKAVGSARVNEVAPPKAKSLWAGA